MSVTAFRGYFGLWPVLFVEKNGNEEERVVIAQWIRHMPWWCMANIIASSLLGLSDSLCFAVSHAKSHVRVH